MPGISGPSVSVSLTGQRLAALQTILAKLSIHHHFTYIALFASAICICPMGALAQTGDITDVHITPRAAAAAAPAASAVAAPSVSTPSVGLKSTDRSIKVNVNLVLVPVTVTDPMNRLVTGLERDNFTLSEG
ncbi:MAG TPA: hypothetical protein VG498_00535, partial [Terriglobales bacterium]|nr:hypothetical protein [Terriglobales bacterium]